MPLVKLYGNLRAYAGSKELSLPGDTIRDVLDALCEVNHLLCSQIFDGDELLGHVRILISGHDIELDEGLDTRIDPDEVIAIFPAIAGGSRPDLINRGT